jgi:two-component system response regulator YesN
MKSPINLSHYEDQIILKVRLQGKNDVNDAITELARAIQMSALSLDNIQYEWNRLANRLLDLLLASGDCELAMPDLSWCQMDETDVLDEFSKSLRTFCFQCIDRLGGKRNQENQRLALLAQTYIQAHYADSHLSLMEVARHANVSLSHFCQIFKEETGKTFVEYLTEIRMERAKEMLRSTDRMLYDIAECVGYENPAYFTVAFKKQVGLSPRDYRKQFGKGS